MGLDFFEGGGGEPADAAVGDADFVPGADVVDEFDFWAFMKDKEVYAFFIGGAFDGYGWGEDDGFFAMNHHILILPGKEEGQEAYENETDSDPEAGFSYGQIPGNDVK